MTKEKYWSNDVVTVYKPDEGDRVNAVLDILQAQQADPADERNRNCGIFNGYVGISNSGIGNYFCSVVYITYDNQ